MRKLFPNRARLLTVLAFGGMALVLLIKLRTFFNFYDEGFAMFGPIRILQGDLPYKDFWAIYPPGQFYIVALLIKLFGPNLVNARLYDTLVRFLLVIGIYWVGRQVATTRLSLLTAGIAAFLLATAGFYSYAVFPAMTLGIWALGCWLHYCETRQRRFLLFAGGLLGVALTIRWDIGAYGALSVLVGGYARLLVERLNLTQESGERFRWTSIFAPLPPLLLILLPMLLLAGAAYAYIGLHSGWQNLYEQVFYFPAVRLHDLRWLAYPRLRYADWIPDEDWLRFFFPLITYAAALLTLAGALLRKRLRLDPAFFTLLSLLIFGILLFNQALSRYDQIHVTPASILAFLIAAAIFQRAAPPLRPAFLRVLSGALLLMLLGLYFPLALKDLLSTLDNAAPWDCHSHLPILSCTVVSPDQEKAVLYIQSQTQPDEPIFVGNQKHNQIFVNDIGFYYLAQRPAASRYHELYPGVATTLPIQQAIAAELEAKQVRWLVLVKIWDSTEPNLSAVDSHVTYLDEYIQSHYSVETAYGIYRIVKRNP